MLYLYYFQSLNCYSKMCKKGKHKQCVRPNYWLILYLLGKIMIPLVLVDITINIDNLLRLASHTAFLYDDFKVIFLVQNTTAIC